MKHNIQVTAILILAFLTIQIFGLVAISQNTIVAVTPEGVVTVVHEDTVVGERPQMQDWVSFAYILFGILIGTLLILFFVRFGQFRLWKGMYFLAIWMASSITLGVFISAYVALIMALIMAILEIYRTNVFIHNVTELFVYPGIAILFVPLFSVPWAMLLLIAISAYDMFAVWKSKHMITLAKFQTESKAFAGFIVPYEKKGGLSGIKTKIPDEIGGKGGTKVAILGGGDIAFPLLFAGVVMDWLIRTVHLTKFDALLQSTVISLLAALALLLLFVKAGKDKFYPAMPFISAGCFAGLGIVWALNFLV